MKKTRLIDDPDDKAMISAYERGALVSVKPRKAALEVARKAAETYRKKKEARVNIRLSEEVLEGIKSKAAEEGLPYQTLIASILHKFVNGRLTSGRA